MSVKVYILERKLHVKSIYGLGFYLQFKNEFTEQYLVPRSLYVPLTHVCDTSHSWIQNRDICYICLLLQHWRYKSTWRQPWSAVWFIGHSSFHNGCYRTTPKHGANVRHFSSALPHAFTSMRALLILTNTCSPITRYLS